MTPDRRPATRGGASETRPPNPRGAAPILAFDTSTGIGSVAVARDGAVVERAYLLRSREQASHLVPRIREVLERAGVAPRELGGVLVGRGPGSFTGVRIAAATARGLSLALGTPVWPISSLAAAAVSDGVPVPDDLPLPRMIGPGTEAAVAGEHPRYVLFDARGNRAYGACFRLRGARIEVLLPPALVTVDALVEEELPAGVMFCGDGALRHAERLQAAGHRVLDAPVGLPTADGLVRAVVLDPGVAARAPGEKWAPEYLRPSSAEREARRSGAGVP